VTWIAECDVCACVKLQLGGAHVFVFCMFTPIAQRGRRFNGILHFMPTYTVTYTDCIIQMNVYTRACVYLHTV
jgi:hypothetical protein